MNIFAFGINHKTAPIEIREKFFLNSTQQELFLSELKSRPEVIEAFVLSTCNRTEVYVHLIKSDIDTQFVLKLIAKIKDVALTTRSGKYFYSYRGEEAVAHLFKVSSGLDSLVLGEKQILGQVKEAVELARSKTMFGKTFNILSNVAVNTGKKVQHETHISCGGSSISWAAIALAEKMMGGLKGKSVLIIGAGKMSELALKQIHKRGVKKIYLMNRTESRAESLAETYNGVCVPFCDIKEILTKADICISAAGAPHYIIEKSTIEKVMKLRHNRPLILVDISMPRNIDPGVAELKHVILSHIDDLEKVVDANMKKRQAAVSDVEQIVTTKVHEFYRKLDKLRQNSTTDYFETVSETTGKSD